MVSSESFMRFAEASQRLTDLGVLNDPYTFPENAKASTFYVETFFPTNKVFHFLATSVTFDNTKQPLRARLLTFDLNTGEVILTSPSSLLLFAAGAVGIKWDDPISLEQINNILSGMEASDAVMENFGIPRLLLPKYLAIEALIKNACDEGELDKSFLSHITDYALLDEPIGTVMRFALAGTTPELVSYYSEIPKTLLDKIFN